MDFKRIADNIIEEAMREGAFDNLPGQGQPLEPLPDGDPFDILMGRIMQRSGALPMEVELKRSIAEKTSAIASIADPDRKSTALLELRDLRLRLDMAMEGRAAQARQR